MEKRKETTGLFEGKEQKKKGVYLAGHYHNGMPYYEGFPEIEHEYNGEKLYGIIIQASISDFSIRLKGYPETAETFSSHIPTAVPQKCGFIVGSEPISC